MRKKKWLFVVGPPAIVAFVALGGIIVQALWNWLLPPLFHLPLITFWEALGVLLLSRILFGRWGGGGPGHGRHGCRPRLRERWDHMTPEERERFREWLRSTTPAPGQ